MPNCHILLENHSNVTLYPDAPLNTEVFVAFSVGLPSCQWQGLVKSSKTGSTNHFVDTSTRVRKLRSHELNCSFMSQRFFGLFSFLFLSSFLPFFLLVYYGLSTYYKSLFPFPHNNFLGPAMCVHSEVMW
jgi:hypothetical protein